MIHPGHPVTEHLGWGVSMGLLPLPPSSAHCTASTSAVGTAHPCLLFLASSVLAGTAQARPLGDPLLSSRPRKGNVRGPQGPCVQLAQAPFAAHLCVWPVPLLRKSVTHSRVCPATC